MISLLMPRIQCRTKSTFSEQGTEFGSPNCKNTMDRSASSSVFFVIACYPQPSIQSSYTRYGEVFGSKLHNSSRSLEAVCPSNKSRVSSAGQKWVTGLEPHLRRTADWQPKMVPVGTRRRKGQQHKMLRAPKIIFCLFEPPNYLHGLK
jgi:hypothetical protein